jgi:3-keto-5-aminohexanoate cleavage enzyme
MSHANPVILTCATSGAVANRDRCPAIPYTSEEDAEDAGRRVATVAEVRERLRTPKRAAA